MSSDTLDFTVFDIIWTERLVCMKRRYLLRFSAGGFFFFFCLCMIIIKSVLSVPEGRGLDWVTFDVHFGHVTFRCN